MPKIRKGGSLPDPPPRKSSEVRAVLSGPEPSAVKQAVYPHAEADHIRFRNDDGTVTVICHCICPDCWPDDGGPCPDATAPC